MKHIARFVLLILALSLVASLFAAASADITESRYCPKCCDTTVWRKKCRNNSAGTYSSYRQHTYYGEVCNYYHEYYYHKLVCSECGNVYYTNSMTHSHKAYHAICGGTAVVCPYY